MRNDACTTSLFAVLSSPLSTGRIRPATPLMEA
jgi:hypothetical protein